MEEIHGFMSPSEYERFVKFIEAQVQHGYWVEVPADPNYPAFGIRGGRWFRSTEGEVWRLVPPDIPYKGAWEPVEVGKLTPSQMQ